MINNFDDLGCSLTHKLEVFYVELIEIKSTFNRYCAKADAWYCAKADAWFIHSFLIQTLKAI